MSRSRRVGLAREVLPSVTAWVELVVGAERAAQLASDAVVAAASARKVTSLAELSRAARDDVARKLAATEAAFPVERPTDEDSAGPKPEPEPDPGRGPGEHAPHDDAPDDASSPYAPGNARPEGEDPLEDEPSDDDPTPDRRSPAELLADALAGLRPHERLAAVRFYLDGESAASVADLFGIPRDDAVALLESVTAILAPVVGEFDLPDFAAEVDEIEVVTR